MIAFRSLTRPVSQTLAFVLCTSGLVSLSATAAMAQVDLNTPQGVREAQQRGMELVYSSNVETVKTREGVELLEAAAESGDVGAMVDLGALYLYATILPKDWPRALDYFEKAAAEGNPDGIYQYGMMLMWSERDPAGAEAMLNRAGEMGANEAWTTLAEGAMYGYLGGGRTSRAKYADYAARARAAGEERVAVLDATRYMWGISVTASGPRTLAVLEEAADAGNAEAAAFLIKLVRSGNRYNVRRDRPRARAYLEKYRGLLSTAEVWQLEVSIEASEARSRSAMQTVTEKVFSRPELMTSGFGADLLDANENLAIYALQTRLTERGFGVGRIDGFVGPRTLRAMNAACRTIAPLASCDDSVMRPDVISSLIENL